MKQKDIIYSEGQPIKTTQDIVDFFEYMTKKYKITQEPGIVKMVVDHYKESPKDKDHIVMNNDGVSNKWFMSFLSDSDVLETRTLMYEK
jgi:hypothetical protein